jgi:hypothetical protein
MNKEKRVLWSREQSTKLKELLNAKLAITEIAKVLNRTEKSIRRKCERLNVSSSTTYEKKKR